MIVVHPSKPMFADIVTVIVTGKPLQFAKESGKHPNSQDALGTSTRRCTWMPATVESCITERPPTSIVGVRSSGTVMMWMVSAQPTRRSRRSRSS
jgi:hypothetical protein